MLDYDKIMPVVKSVARSVSSKFPSYVQEEDTLGALLLFLYQKRESIERAVEDGPEWEAKIASTLRKVAFDHCNAEKAAAEGYDPSDIYRYSVPKIKSLIADAMDYENWQSFSKVGDGQPKAAAQTYGDRVTELIDVKEALSKLNDETYNFLVYQHKYDYTLEEVAIAMGITLEAAKKRSQRALKALQKGLGYKESPSPRRAGRRAVRSNASWRADLSTGYEG
ncbi:MAG TPA: sigma factor-like helix-turn-helix DNA-binding protein [Candidatus Paceibacterota bacterium]